MSDDRYTTTIHWRDADQLDRAYWDYYWSTVEIGEWVNVGNSTICRVLEENGIPTRDKGDADAVRRMKERGRSLEYISQQVPDPRIRDSHGVRQEDTDDSGVPWGEHQ